MIFVSCHPFDDSKLKFLSPQGTLNLRRLSVVPSFSSTSASFSESFMIFWTLYDDFSEHFNRSPSIAASSADGTAGSSFIGIEKFCLFVLRRNDDTGGKTRPTSSPTLVSGESSRIFLILEDSKKEKMGKMGKMIYDDVADFGVDLESLEASR
jgi:hypothetical protein